MQPYQLFENREDSLLFAQVMALAAFFIGLSGWYISFVAGSVCLGILILACCVRFDRDIFGVAGICALIAALGNFLVAARATDLSVMCREERCGFTDEHLAILAAVGGILWVVVAFFCFDMDRGSCRRSC